MFPPSWARSSGMNEVAAPSLQGQLSEEGRDSVPGVAAPLQPGHHAAPSRLRRHSPRQMRLPMRTFQQLQIQTWNTHDLMPVHQSRGPCSCPEPLLVHFGSLHNVCALQGPLQPGSNAEMSSLKQRIANCQRAAIRAYCLQTAESNLLRIREIGSRFESPVASLLSASTSVWTCSLCASVPNTSRSPCSISSGLTPFLTSSCVVQQLLASLPYALPYCHTPAC